MESPLVGHLYTSEAFIRKAESLASFHQTPWTLNLLQAARGSPQCPLLSKELPLTSFHMLFSHEASRQTPQNTQPSSAAACTPHRNWCHLLIIRKDQQPFMKPAQVSAAKFVWLGKRLKGSKVAFQYSPLHREQGTVGGQARTGSSQGTMCQSAVQPRRRSTGWGPWGLTLTL